MKRCDLLLAALAPSQPLNLRDDAAHVANAEKDNGHRKILGRIGVTASEHESAASVVD